MRNSTKVTTIFILLICLGLLSCSENGGDSPASNSPISAEPSPEPLPGDEILSSRDSSTSSPIGAFDFKNHTYPLPRGWQDPDGADVKLRDGVRPLNEEEGRIGLRYITTKFFDVTGDGVDEALVLVRIDTGGSSIPQVVYLFTSGSAGPELLWMFRTGDRADGGVKNIYAEGKEVVVELFGKDRYILGDVETMRITGDEDDLCCPSSFTRTKYALSGKNFRLVGKRLTYNLASPSDLPVENMGEEASRR